MSRLSVGLQTLEIENQDVRAGFDSCPNTGDETPYHQVRHTKCTGLQCGANNDPGHGEPHCSPPAKVVANEKVKYAPTEAT